MWQRVTGAVAGCALAVCMLAGCSLIFPFDVEPDVDGGARLDLGAREGGADGPLMDSDGPPMDNDGPHKDVSKPPDGQLPTDGPKPSCVQMCPYPSWCSALTSAPVAAQLNAVWGGGENDLWAVGDLGTVLKYNPSNCKWEPANLTQGLSSAELLTLATTNLYGVWGDGGAVYVVGARETILRYNGSAWTRDHYTAPSAKVPIPPLLLAVGGAPGQIVAVGTAGKAYNLVGSSWVTWSSNSSKALRGVSGPTSTPGLGSLGAIYVVGSGGELLYHDDATVKTLSSMPASGCLYSHDWQGVWAAPSPPAPPTPELVAVAATGEVLRYHSTAGKCTLDKTLKKALVAGQTVRALGGVVATDLWAVGTLGFVGRKNAAGSWGKAQQLKTAVTLHGVTVLQQPRWVVAVGDVGTIIRTSY